MSNYTLKADEMSSGSHMMQYGAPAGDSRFLKALRQFLADEYADTVQMFVFSHFSKKFSAANKIVERMNFLRSVCGKFLRNV